MRSALAFALAGLALLPACAVPPRVETLWRAALGPREPVLVLREEPPAGLPPPEGLRAGSGGFREVRLEWEPLLAGSVGGYAVERAFAVEGPFARVAVVLGRFSTVYVDGAGSPEQLEAEPLGDGMAAFYRVRAFAPSGHLSSAAASPVFAHTAPVPPAPQDLRAYSLQPRMVPLTWSASEDESVAGYQVERSPSSQGPFEVIARLQGRGSTRYVDRGLGDLRVLHYRVAALNPGGAAGPPTPVLRAVTKPEPLPPFRMRVVEQRLGANRLEWDANVEDDLAGYRVLRRREGAEGTEVVASLPPDQTRVEDTAVGADERVSYTAVAIDQDGLKSGRAVPIALTSEGYRAAALAASDRVELRWDPRRGEGFQRARVLRASGLRTRELGVVEDEVYVDRDVTPGARYRYTIVLERADASQAPPSSPVEVRIPRT